MVVFEPAGGIEEAEDVFGDDGNDDADDGVEGVVDCLGDAVGAIRDERSIAPFQDVKRDVPKGKISKDDEEPQGKTFGDEFPGDGGDFCSGR